MILTLQVGVVTESQQMALQDEHCRQNMAHSTLQEMYTELWSTAIMEFPGDS